MPSNRLTGFSSAFDELLARSRRELDALSGGSGAPALSPTSRTAPRPSADSPPAARSASIRAPMPASPESRSPAERALDAKLGADWRHEVLDRTREGGELVVRCRVTVPARGISRTWIGTAALTGAGGSSGTKGTAGNVSFTLGGGAGSGAGSDMPLRAEREAERQAVESALAACARLF